MGRGQQLSTGLSAAQLLTAGTGRALRSPATSSAELFFPVLDPTLKNGEPPRNVFALRTDDLAVEVPQTTIAGRAAYIRTLPLSSDVAGHHLAFKVLWRLFVVEGRTLSLSSAGRGDADRSSVLDELRKAEVKGVTTDPQVRELLHEFRWRMFVPLVYRADQAAGEEGVRCARSRDEVTTEADRDKGRGSEVHEYAKALSHAGEPWVNGDHSALDRVEPERRPLVDALLGLLSTEPLPAKEIAEQLDNDGWNRSDAWPGRAASPLLVEGREPGVHMRRLIHELVEKYGIAICSGADGFFVPKSAADLQRGLSPLLSRDEASQERARLMRTIRGIWFPASEKEHEIRAQLCSRPPHSQAPSPRWASRKASAEAAADERKAKTEGVEARHRAMARTRFEDMRGQYEALVAAARHRSLTRSESDFVKEARAARTYSETGTKPRRRKGQAQWSWLPSSTGATPAAASNASSPSEPMPWR